MKGFTFVAFGAFAFFFIFYIYTLIHVNATCDGVVVKNVFDWPVCIERGQ